MKKSFLFTIGPWLSIPQVGLSRIVTGDSILGTAVTCGGGYCAITGGTLKDGNLFHSFSQF